MDHLRRLRRRVVGSALFPGLVAAFAALVGLIGSVYEHEVVRAFPINLAGPYTTFSGRALLFWIALASLATLVYFRQAVDDEIRDRLSSTTTSAEETSRRIEATSKRIEDFVQTLPPAAFQSNLANTVVAIDRSVWSAMPRQVGQDVTRDDLAKVARSILHSVAVLAKVYDNEPLVDGHPACYCANVMVFVPRASLVHDVPLRFFPEDYDREALKGALELVPELSAASESQHDEPDPHMQRMFLPVPQEAKRNERWTVLPGAPLAFLDGQTTGYNDTSTLPQWCLREADFPPSVADQLRTYFAGPGGQQIRSFISRRLVSSSGDPLGVLNIHADRRDVLGPRSEKRETFQALLTPVFEDLTDVIEAWINGRPSPAKDVTRVDVA